jgi:hypothetical protein
VNVTSPAGCGYTAENNASWIRIYSGANNRFGNGVVRYFVFATTGTTPRSGTITMAGQRFTVNQAGSNVVNRR